MRSLRALGTGPDDAARLHDAARQLETLILKQLVTASRAFTGGEGAGSAVRADLFADALASALVDGGGIGLARQIEASLARGAAAPGGIPATLPRPAPASAGSTTGMTPMAETGTTAAAGTVRVTSGFGVRADPLDGHLMRHEGVDLAGPEGATIHAAGAGTVRRSGARGGYGTAIEIDHGNGVSTLYAHASALLVGDGDAVAPGQPIARVGHTGRATGPHVHFEVRVGGRSIDPARALKAYELRADGMVDSGS